MWLLLNCKEVQNALKENRLMVGTIDTWLIWNLTNREKYVTDATNASRTMLMNIETLEWDDELCSFFEINPNILANICSSAEMFGMMHYDGSPFCKVPITGCLGDQQAALVGQQCFKVIVHLIFIHNQCNFYALNYFHQTQHSTQIIILEDSEKFIELHYNKSEMKCSSLWVKLVKS